MISEPFNCALCGRESWIGLKRDGVEGYVGQCCATQGEREILAKLKKASLTSMLKV